MEKYGDPTFAQRSLYQCYNSLLKYSKAAAKEKRIRQNGRRKRMEYVESELENLANDKPGTPSHGSTHHNLSSLSASINVHPPHVAVSSLHHDNSENNMSVNSTQSSINGDNKMEGIVEEVSLLDAETSRFLMRVNLFLRMFQLDSQRTYSSRLTTVVTNILEKFCKGGKTVQQFLGKAVKVNWDKRCEEIATGVTPPALDVIAQLNQGDDTMEAITNKATDKENIEKSGSGGNNEDNGSLCGTVAVVDENNIKWRIHEKVMISRKELLLTLLFDTSNESHELVAAHTNSRGGVGMRQKGTVSAILLEIQKGVSIYYSSFFYHVKK